MEKKLDLDQVREDEGKGVDYTKRKSHRRRKKKKVWKIVLTVLSVLALLVCVGFASFVVLQKTGKSSLMKYAGTEQMTMKNTEESGLVSKNGKKYKYNENVITLLCMGIDKDSTSWEETGYIGENGQADAIFLLALNPDAGSLDIIGISRDTMTEIATYDKQGNYVGESVNHLAADAIFLLALNPDAGSLDIIGISRDTMTEIATYDKQGNYVGESVNHLALAFSYGKTKEEGAELVKTAVSKLFYNLPVHGYAAIDWDALGKINDSVGGVEVTFNEEVVLNGETFAGGEKMRLTGEQAKSFVRQRGDEIGSNNKRMQRQKIYAAAFIGAAKNAVLENPLLVSDMYKELSGDMVTSIGVDEAVYLASLLPSMRFSLDDIQMIEGEVKEGTVYEEFYADEDKLMNLILDIFYYEVY